MNEMNLPWIPEGSEKSTEGKESHEGAHQDMLGLVVVWCYTSSVQMQLATAVLVVAEGEQPERSRTGRHFHPDTCAYPVHIRSSPQCLSWVFPSLIALPACFCEGIYRITYRS